MGNLTEWTRATWYIQEQQVTQYLSTKQNYCVAATYGFDGAELKAGGFPIDPFYHGPVISVYNYANEEKVNGKLTNEDSMILCARVPDSDETSKLAVAPCFLPTVRQPTCAHNPVAAFTFASLLISHPALCAAQFFAGPYWILKAKEDSAGQYE